MCRMMGSDIIWYPQPKMIASIANDMRLKAFKTNTDRERVAAVADNEQQLPQLSMEHVVVYTKIRPHL